MGRDEMVSRIEDHREPWDMVFVGGGATGVAGALDAAARGYDVLLVDQSDFGKATSSRSTKLVHGGVRYLQQGNLPLVMEALQERGIMRQNAPHLVHDLGFIVPNYTWWEAPFYGIGMKVYDMLAGRYGFGRSRVLSIDETVARIPTIALEGLRGGVAYYDGQFDDARMLINMVQTAAEQGATLVNYAKVVALTKSSEGFVDGVIVRDLEGDQEHTIRAKVVINCTGPFADELRRMNDPEAQSMIAGSTGVHVVLDRAFLPGDYAIMVPRTADGRVLFAIPWYDKVVLGTTDVPTTDFTMEPWPTTEEVTFILENAEGYLERTPSQDDILSVFSGIRPLVKAADDAETSQLSRDHTISVTKSGLVTIAGGKWTTCRHMAEDLIDNALIVADLEPQPCVTRQLRIHGYHRNADKFGVLEPYGSDAPAIEDSLRRHPDYREPLHPRLPAVVGQVLWAVRAEMARTVDDVLARRTRSLLLDAQAAIAAAPQVARIMAREMGKGEPWQRAQVESFRSIAKRYLASETRSAER
ncbi:MAG: glycerol-3-phosphate dehydrogenase/oxidase [Deltaproteobacteria bacterium]|nr:glycerol-3-phosphate dehydrogenase/oxidase [Deltaproteobacteria bacterium]MBW2534877.1 glycerol-3-phosphate dehydrogenase/oxidase [Deltaproteobacteria bacterium]